MSVTSTANPVSGAVLKALTDYDLHHSGQPERPGTPEQPNTQANSSQVIKNPESWDNEHRRVPPHRPVDHSLYGAERPGGVNAVGMTFIYVMLHGVGLVANVNAAWRATGGKINDRMFRYRIGGEW